MKLFQFILTAFSILILSSCQKAWFTQNPLEEIHPQLKEGTLETGSKNVSMFEDFIVGEMLRVRIKNESDLVMNFVEGEKKSYEIKFDLLNDFKNKYEILILDSPFKKLPHSDWQYDSDSQTGELVWTPDKVFNKGAVYTTFSLDALFTLKKLASSNKGSQLTVKKTVQVFVHKNIFLPKIVKIETSHQSFIRLDDDNFYENHGIDTLNLDYYDQIFIDKDTQVSAKDLLVYIFLFDKKSQSIPYYLSRYMQRPYYELIDNTAKAECAGLNDDESLCWTVLKDRRNVSLDKDIYIREYLIPRTVDLKKLYYKVESFDVCGVYNSADSFTNIKDPIFKKAFEESNGELCYLSLAQTAGSLNYSVSENSSIYELKNNDELKLINLFEWQSSFKKIQDHLKWQLSGYYPVESIEMLYVNLKHGSPIYFEIEDINHFSSVPEIYFENSLSQTVNSLKPFDIRLNLIKSIDFSLFKLSFMFFVPDQNSYKSYKFKVRPVNGLVKGDSIPIQISVFPSIVREIEYVFDSKKDVETSKNFNQNGEWLQTSLSINRDINIRYVFSTDFYENLDSYNSELELDTLKRYVETSNHLVKPVSSVCSNAGYPFLKKSDCVCAEKKFYMNEEDGNIFLETTCNYTAVLNFNSSYINSQAEDVSGYFQYNYGFFDDKNRVFNFFDVKEKNKISQTTLLVTDKYYVRDETQLSSKQSESKESYRTEMMRDSNNSENALHVFFNLKPKWVCETSSENKKRNCKFVYKLKENFPRNISHELLSDIGLQVQTACFDINDQNNYTSKNQYNCECSELNFRRNSENYGSSGVNVEMIEGPGLIRNTYSSKNHEKSSYQLEFDCVFDVDRKSALEFFLKTQNPSIYFLHKGEEGFKQTPLEKAYIKN